MTPENDPKQPAEGFPAPDNRLRERQQRRRVPSTIKRDDWAWIIITVAAVIVVIAVVLVFSAVFSSV